jgi:carboxypeptidase Q
MPRMLAPHLALALAAMAAPPSPPPATDAAAARIVGGALTDGAAHARLAELTDTVGARLAGSPGNAAAVEWAVRRLREDGVAVRTEPVTVPRWERRAERAEVVARDGQRAQPLAVTALGTSPGTPKGGVTAEVVEVKSLDELVALGERARGRIVLFQHAMSTPEGYGASSALRTRGPAAAARAGAAAALVRSLSTMAHRTPHTGATRFPPGQPQIPAAALAVEDAELLHRLVARGPVTVRLELDCGMASPPTAESANVVAEVRGREKPDEVVLVGAHLDSWDLATGAVDDGAGVAMVMEAMRLLAREPRPPRRTVRAVLFANEESGLSGAVAYAEQHRGELARHVAAFEADSGAGRPTGIHVDAGAGGEALLARLAAPIVSQLLPRGIARGEGGADVQPLRYAGVPVLQIQQDVTHYFDWHHSAADTLDKVAPEELAQGAAAVAWMAWSLAESDEVLPRPPPPEKPAWWLSASDARR